MESPAGVIFRRGNHKIFSAQGIDISTNVSYNGDVAHLTIYTIRSLGNVWLIGWVASIEIIIMIFGIKIILYFGDIMKKIKVILVAILTICSLCLFSACSFAFDEWSKGFVRAELVYIDCPELAKTEHVIDVAYQLSEEEGKDLVVNLAQIDFKRFYVTSPSWVPIGEYSFRLFYVDKTIVIRRNQIICYDLNNQIIQVDGSSGHPRGFPMRLNAELLDLLDYYIMKVNGITA